MIPPTTQAPVLGLRMRSSRNSNGGGPPSDFCDGCDHIDRVKIMIQQDEKYQCSDYLASSTAAALQDKESSTCVFDDDDDNSMDIDNTITDQQQDNSQNQQQENHHLSILWMLFVVKRCVNGVIEYVIISIPDVKLLLYPFHTSIGSLTNVVVTVVHSN